MHHQIHLLAKNDMKIKSKWQKAKQLIKKTVECLTETELTLKNAFKENQFG